jgi:ElaB/YqjD/DUF883 family membrane-anchored ribosome-binding protein
MPAARKDRLSSLIREVESAAKRLRNDVRKRANAAQLQKNLQNAAAQLRKRAAAAAGQVEKYVHDIRKDLEGKAAAVAKKPKARRSAKRRSSTRRRAKA